jgi:hypothetical protein
MGTEAVNTHSLSKSSEGKLKEEMRVTEKKT